MNLAIWDIESSSASTDFGSIIEIGGILVDENFKEKDRFNLRCRLPAGNLHLRLNLSFSLKFSSTNIPPISIMLPKSVLALELSMSHIAKFIFAFY